MEWEAGSLERMEISWWREPRPHHRQREKRDRKPQAEQSQCFQNQKHPYPGDKDEEIHNEKKQSITEGFIDHGKTLRSLDFDSAL